VKLRAIDGHRHTLNQSHERVCVAVDIGGQHVEERADERARGWSGNGVCICRCSGLAKMKGVYVKMQWIETKGNGSV
jgi:hypothetical protein